MKYISIWMVGCMLLSLGAKAQQVVKLDLQRTIEIANDSSLSAFRYQNLYLSGYWEYRTYKANRLPSLTLDLTPAKYYRYITQRYDSNEDMDVYREQQMFSASGGLSIKQNWIGRAVLSILIRNWTLCVISVTQSLHSIPVSLCVWDINRACWDIMLFVGTGK